MKKRMRTAWSMLLAVLLCIGMLPVSAFAEGNAPVTATIPVSVTVNGKNGALDSDVPEETYTFELKALNNAPLPESNTVTIKGVGKAEFQIGYSSVGVYRYTVSQNTEAMTNRSSRGHYDTCIYYVVVTVTNTQDGLGVTVSAHKNGEQNDKSEIIFDNTYDPLPEPTPDPTPDPKPDPEPTPNPPTPPDKLIQTGQLNWPIPVLLLLGFVMISCGICAVRKKEKKNE